MSEMKLDMNAMAYDELPADAFEKLPEDQKNKTEFINHQSLALKFTFGDSTVMLAGDLYVGGEKVTL